MKFMGKFESLSIYSLFC